MLFHYDGAGVDLNGDAVRYTAPTAVSPAASLSRLGQSSGPSPDTRVRNLWRVGSLHRPLANVMLTQLSRSRAEREATNGVGSDSEGAGDGLGRL